MLSIFWLKWIPAAAGPVMFVLALFGVPAGMLATFLSPFGARRRPARSAP